MLFASLYQQAVVLTLLAAVVGVILSRLLAGISDQALADPPSAH